MSGGDGELLIAAAMAYEKHAARCEERAGRWFMHLSPSLLLERGDLRATAHQDRAIARLIRAVWNDADLSPNITQAAFRLARLVAPAASPVTAEANNERTAEDDAKPT